MSTCARCGRPVIWVRTESGLRMPIDAEPVPGGSVLVLRNGYCKVLPASKREASIVPLYKTHYATCPTAEEDRERSRRS